LTLKQKRAETCYTDYEQNSNQKELLKMSVLEYFAEELMLMHKRAALKAYF